MGSQDAQVLGPARDAVIKDLFRLGVVRIDVDQGFALAAGGRSPVYLDHRRLFGEPGVREAALDLWCTTLKEFLQLKVLVGGAFCPKDWVVAGTATAGIAPAFGLAGLLKCPFAYVRSGAKSHGLARRIEGADVQGRRVVVVDDMVTTGLSLMQAAEALNEEGAHAVAATSFTSRISREELRGSAKAAGSEEPWCLPFHAVLSLSLLFSRAVELGLVSEGQWPNLKAWLQSHH
jgi:orotate phosphoribosyltransferase